MAPTEEEIVIKLKQLIEQVPELGKKKLLSRLNSENGWDISSKDFRVYMCSIEDDRKRAAENAKQQASQHQDEDNASGVGMLTGVMQGTSIVEAHRENLEDIFEGQSLQEWVISAENPIDTPPKLPDDAWAAQLK